MKKTILFLLCLISLAPIFNVAEASNGDLKICLMLADSANSVATSSASLPAGSFSINIATSIPVASSTIFSKTWNASTFTPNTKIILSENDAECVTVALDPAESYFYSQLGVSGSNWGTPLYNDQLLGTINTTSDFFPYNTDIGNGTFPIANSNSVINLSLTSGQRTFAIYNTYNPTVIVPPTTPPANISPTMTILGANPLHLTAGNIFVDPGATSTDFEDGDLTSAIVVTGSVNSSTPGSYTLTYTVTDSDGASISMNRSVIVNPASNFKIIATKIVCSNETDLPNWGASGPDITSATASTFLSSHPNCHLQAGWNFEWGYQNVTDPGSSFLGNAGNGWNTFGSTNSQGQTEVNIPATSTSDRIWIREVLKPGFLSFFGPYATNASNTNVVSAEMLCHQDVLYFDNYDYVLSPQNGNTYHCLALNVDLNPATTTPNTPPTISLVGSNPFLVATDTPFIDPGATATDLEDGNATTTSHIIVTGSVNASTTGSYILTYSVTDSGGLSASTTRTVIINSTSTTTPPSNPPSTPPTNPPTDNGGGGGGLGGHRRQVVTGQVLGATTCSYLKDFIHKDWVNNPVEVMKVQSFMNIFEKESLTVNGNYDTATFAAVSRFQNKYASEILTPWGHTAPTGFVYILTKNKINEIYCNSFIPLTSSEEQEILAFKTYLQNIKNNSATDPTNSNKPEPVIDLSDYVGINEDGSIKNKFEDKAKVVIANVATTVKNGVDGAVESVAKNDSLKNLAISLLGMPKGLAHVSSTYLLIALALILAIAYAMKNGSNNKPNSVIILESKKEEKISDFPKTEAEARIDNWVEGLEEEGIIAKNDADKDDNTDGDSSNNSSGSGFKGIIG